MLSRVRKLVISFAPLSEKSKSAAGLLARVRGPGSRKNNPECTVEHNLLIKGEPFLEIEYTNNEQVKLSTAVLSEQDIISQITEKCLNIETAEVLKKSGLLGTRLEVAANDDRYHAGSSRKIPIT